MYDRAASCFNIVTEMKDIIPDAGDVAVRGRMMNVIVCRCPGLWCRCRHWRQMFRRWGDVANLFTVRGASPRPRTWQTEASTTREGDHGRRPTATKPRHRLDEMSSCRQDGITSTMTCWHRCYWRQSRRVAMTTRHVTTVTSRAPARAIAASL